MSEKYRRWIEERGVVDCSPLGAHPAFFDPFPHQMTRPDLNACVEEYFALGSPIILGRDAPMYKGRWKECFSGELRPLMLEIGSGNGFFLSGRALQRPDCDWIGVEIRYKRVVMVAKKIRAMQASNARICRFDNWCLDELFGPQTLSGLFTNHPDPWGKKKHAKKRILSVPFFNWAASVLKQGAEWRIKTDFRIHFDKVLSMSSSSPYFTVTGQSQDVHRDGVQSSLPWSGSEDIVTNYEQKFIDKSEPIYALRLQRSATPYAD